jgi:anaerobic selenocysteine-containing dehydrogenase
VAREGDEFLLLSGRMIYDDGHMVSRSKALAAVTRRPFVEMAAADVERLGLTEGAEAVVSSDGVEERAPVVVGDIAPGAVFVPYDQPGLRANRLMRGFDTKVRVGPA